MQWFITYPRKVVSFKTKLVRPEETINGTDFDEFVDLFQEAWNKGEEIQAHIEQIDPTPQHLYDNTGGEPFISADERWQTAFDQHRQLHS